MPSVEVLQQRLNVIQAENDELRERIMQLQEQMGMTLEVPVEFGLTRSECQVFGALLSRELMTKEGIYMALYGQLGAIDVDMKIIDVFVCKMRKKLSPFGIEINTVWGRGYMIPRTARDKVKTILEANRNAA